jgi:hypothetical protein
VNSINTIERILAWGRGLGQAARRSEQQQLMLGRLLSLQQQGLRPPQYLSEVEFKVFSQWGDDGIIQWLIRQIDFPHQTFIEFGVEDYQEANTRFLMINNNWSGLVMDGSPTHVQAIQSADYYWQYELRAKCAFIDAENINTLIAEEGFARDLGLLHIDLDGNDYWIWKALNVVSPVLVILEYNAVFGAERAITVPYDAKFLRHQAHHSNLYFGASLPALCQLSNDKGYAFVGCNGAGNNAYFVRRDKLPVAVKEVSVAEGFVPSKFRESRDANGGLSLLTGPARLESLRGLPVFNTTAMQAEVI